MIVSERVWCLSTVNDCLLKLYDQIMQWLCPETVDINQEDWDKENFENNPKCRLINSAKSESGKLGKAFLDKINSNLRKILNLSQWKNTQNVTEWFGNIENKNRRTFISLDIVDFSPSMWEKLLDQTLSWASSLTTFQKTKLP